MVATGLNVRTKQIGDELARLIKTGSGAFGTGLQVCQFGDVQLLAAVPKARTLLPAIYVKPSTTTIEPFDLAGAIQDVTETFRIAYAFGLSESTTRVLDDVNDALNSAVGALAADRTLSSLSLGGGDQIVASDALGIEWADSLEDLFLQEQAIPIKVAVLLWQVKWRAV